MHNKKRSCLELRPVRAATWRVREFWERFWRVLVIVEIRQASLLVSLSIADIAVSGSHIHYVSPKATQPWGSSHIPEE